ncbi:TRAP transporter large permease subunit [Ferrimonas sediminicola]|uniref:TRAP transporter large permease protein n=1 Tax=Ferrimonas sediminicola TaxID=2569538 RepID=A0A4U1BFJ4_9GAMM|nr:TRAP transporter large permease subunit [Ferrimonas sediminicola]TKB49700.1 TRAP transporter large permease subunit [Ferrimonas sediminicola]
MIALLLFASVCLVLMTGVPVAFALAGTALWFALLGSAAGLFDWAFVTALPNRLYGILNNQTLLAVPLFVLMGVILERSRLAEQLLDAMGQLFGRVRAGLAISVMLVGTLLAASTGIVGATVVTMGLISLPAMLKRGYDPAFSAGAICATGTLGQIIPPSIALVLLGDVLSSAFQQAQLKSGIFTPRTVSVGDLFAGALIPGLMLVSLYILYTLWLARRHPQRFDRLTDAVNPEGALIRQLLMALVPPLLLIVLVLGSILLGLATPTEAAAVGAGGALVLAAARRSLNLETLQTSLMETVRITAMVFMILVGASLFSLVFRGLGGEPLIHGLLSSLPGGVIGATLLVMLLVFLLGFILDFIEITFVVVPLVAPTLLLMGVDPVWLGIMLALNLQTSFLTPPFGFALFYLRGVAPSGLDSLTLYRGVWPFIMLQLLMMTLLALWPSLATWLPSQIYG